MSEALKLAVRIAEAEVMLPSAVVREREKATAERAELDALRAEVERLKSPEVVLAEAERLLTELNVCNVRLGGGSSLAENYAKLKEARDA